MLRAILRLVFGNSLEPARGGQPPSTKLPKPAPTPSVIAKSREYDQIARIDGVPTSSFGPKIDELKRRSADQELEFLLQRLIDQNLKAHSVTGMGLAPAWYWELAVLYRKQDRLSDEVAVIEGYFAAQRTSPGAMHGKLGERLVKARTLAARKASKV